MDETPWEWIQGDPVYAARYGFLRGVLFGGVIALVAAYLVLLFANLFGPPSAGSWLPEWVATLWMPTVLGFEAAIFLGLAWYQSHRPVVARLGVSPIGVRFVLPATPGSGGRLVSWWGVSVRGPETVRLELGWPWTTLRLTPAQMRRLTSFWSVPAALPR
jgi:hypothetical protein